MLSFILELALIQYFLKVRDLPRRSTRLHDFLNSCFRTFTVWYFPTELLYIQRHGSKLWKIQASRVRFSKYTMSRLRYLGWDFVSILWENLDISDEIVSFALSRLRYLDIRLKFYISISRILYLEWDCLCLHRLGYL